MILRISVIAKQRHEKLQKQLFGIHDSYDDPLAPLPSFYSPDIEIQ